MKYGDLPKDLGIYKVDCKEMFFYQYLPIKFVDSVAPVYEDRLKCFDKLIGAVCCDFIGEFGLDRYVNSNVYLTAKSLYQKPSCGFNREGWHSDGFMTEDINYVWSDKQPTIFNTTELDLLQDDLLSMEQMNNEINSLNNVEYQQGSLLRLNQFNIHKVGNIEEGRRVFIKVSFSDDKYDLEGNSHNYLLDYDWKMRPRNKERNIPQRV